MLIKPIATMKIKINNDLLLLDLNKCLLVAFCTNSTIKMELLLRYFENVSALLVPVPATGIGNSWAVIL